MSKDFKLFLLEIIKECNKEEYKEYPIETTFSDTTPRELLTVLNEIGYEVEDIEYDGRELDFYFYLSYEKYDDEDNLIKDLNFPPLVIYGSGMDNTLFMRKENLDD